MENSQTLLNGMSEAALEAGAVILSHYSGDIKVEFKADHSPVTTADCAAEAVIIRTLSIIAPHIPIIAEEQIAAGYKPESLGQRFFLVDPLDGTREFIAKNGEFTVNIALIDNGVPVLGVIYVPVKDWLFCGGPQGAYEMIYHNGALETRRAIHGRRLPPRPIAVSSRSHRSEKTQQWLQTHDLAECRSIGSSLKFCLLARGEADVYPRFENCMEWDTAAGDAILRAAGGMVRGLDGVPLAYGKCAKLGRPDFLQDFFIAYGDTEASID